MDRLDALAAQVRELEAQLRSRSGAVDEALGNRAFADRLTDRVEVLVQRVDTLSDTARAASSGLVARERELAAIRREVVDVHVKVDSAVADFQRRVDRAPVEALQRIVAGLVDDIAAFQQSQDVLTGRLDSIADTAEAARATITAHERALGSLSTELEAVGTRMDSVVVVVRQAVESLLERVEDTPAGESTLPLGGLTERVESLASELTSSVSVFAERERALTDSQLRLEQRLDELAEKLAGRGARPRLVTWGQRVTEPDNGQEELPRGELLPAAGAVSGDESSADRTDGENETRDPIASFGGGT